MDILGLLKNLTQWVADIYAVLTSRKDYNNSTSLITDAGQINTSNVVEVTFINYGTATVIINNNLPIPPNTGIGFDGKKGERDTTVYTIGFQGGGTQMCGVIRKYYN